MAQELYGLMEKYFDDHLDLKLRTDKYVYEHAQLALLYLKLCRENMCTDVNEMTDLDFEREQLLCHYEEAIKKGVEEIVFSKEKTITLLIKLRKHFVSICNNLHEICEEIMKEIEGKVFDKKECLEKEVFV
ncbi:Oidioi.mRNA.OKI2018_I69.chr2.g7426.t1.cds [Oikopleura dioica]|uniref:Oidioi.mRNA.OKI2018_I69.chr2.g7426.t1.cds n=1 Tax=Oikopleura dioica TaxID=34765 RepID=A0ABN7TCT2_OIKDI|nr:Oidioi.mRNA.OKI2018_I69.chr2.g7426.t1.cds [Oikopleura dioica]